MKGENVTCKISFEIQNITTNKPKEEKNVEVKINHLATIYIYIYICVCIIYVYTIYMYMYKCI